MFSFQKPKYNSKRVNPITQKPEPSYQFDMVYKNDIEDSPVSWLVTLEDPLTVESLEENIKAHSCWWDAVLNEFLQANSSYFSRPYTAQQIQKIIKHKFVPANIQNVCNPPYYVHVIPYHMELVGGLMYVYWKHKTFPVDIHIPVEDQDNTECPVEVNDKLLQKDDDIEEWDPDEVPMNKEEKEESYMENGAKLMDKQRVREARLKAKLAVYRAQYQMNKFYDKYGDAISDSDSDATSDATSDEEEEEL
jgi:hypothetical protein